jgi:hypothetical protein
MYFVVASNKLITFSIYRLLSANANANANADELLTLGKMHCADSSFKVFFN